MGVIAIILILLLLFRMGGEATSSDEGCLTYLVIFGPIAIGAFIGYQMDMANGSPNGTEGALQGGCYGFIAMVAFFIYLYNSQKR